LSGVLGAAGVLLVVAAAAVAILAPPSRLRSAAMLAAIALVPILVLGDQWHSHRIVDLRNHPSHLAALAIVGLAATVALAAAFRRWPIALPLAIVAALPFRIPLESGGESANLLVPLYLVIAGGVVAAAIQSWSVPRVGFVRRPPGSRGPVAWLPRILAGVVVLYGLQALYSVDFSKGLQDVCFFYVPFAVAYGLLSDFEWDRKLLTWVLWVVAVEAVLFVLVGLVEYLTRGLFWNHQVIRSDEFHTYFRVNSVFWDPNIYGRYLALAIIVATAALLWAKERRGFLLLTALVAVLWIGLAPTFSQSSFIALLAGLAVLAALRWSLRWTAAVVALGALGAILVVLLVGGAGKININRLNIDTSGRANLVSGGIRLFDQRPLYGYGSGSFSTAYRDHARNHRAPVSVSHTEPMTIAAEQGLVGLALYAALIVTSLWTMAANLRPALSRLSIPRTGGGSPPSVPAEEPARRQPIARAAVLAAFTALIVHTMAYAGFYEDPIAWVLLAVGASLAAAAQVRAAS
jgi:O-antigen ligase